jgi:anti-sigma factor (TIGR02949 family)
LDKTHLCRRFERDLFHFQAGELPEDEQRALADHVDGCPGCARRLEVEDGFLRGLKGRLGREEAPPELRVRVREALENQAAPRRSPGWLRTPWLVPAAAALLLAVLLIPAMPPWAGVMHVEREVTVVDIDCEGAGRTLEEQRLCAHPHHLNALKVGPDQYWNISLQQEAGRRLVADREMRGHRVLVTGDLYTSIRTLHVTGFADQDLARNSHKASADAADLLLSLRLFEEPRP